MDISQLLQFLNDLQVNNSKEWMDAHRPAYLLAKTSFSTLIEALLLSLQQTEPELSGLTAKDCIFRINRDIRFSKNKAPYKNNFGASIAEGGKKSLNAGFYIHIQPNNESFIGGGLYMPPGEHLKKIRQEIDYNPAALQEIVLGKEFKQFFGNIQGEKLMRAPQGYSPEHPNIEFLKLKSYVVLHKLSDAALYAPNLEENLIYKCQVMKPFIDFLNVAIS